MSKMLNRRNLLRIALNMFMLAALLWLPWYVMLIIALPLVFYYRAYEVLVWGVAGDMLYAVSSPPFLGLPIFFTVLFVVLFLSAEYAKRFLVFY